MHIIILNRTTSISSMANWDESLLIRTMLMHSPVR